jgi:hypothetical protein
MSKTLDIDLSRVAALPEAAQEMIARELLDRVETLSKMRDEIDAGARCGSWSAARGRRFDPGSARGT